MGWLILGLQLFLGVHSLSIVSPAGREQLMLPVFVLLLAVKLWALSHLLAQSVTGGTLADVLLFGVRPFG